MIDALLTHREREHASLIVLVLAAIFVTPLLFILVNRPELLQQWDAIDLLLVGAMVGFPMLFCGLFAVRAGIERSRPDVPGKEQLQPTQWGLIVHSAGISNAIFIALAGISYFRPLRIGATCILVGSSLVVFWFLTAVAFAIRDYRASRRGGPPRSAGASR